MADPSKSIVVIVVLLGLLAESTCALTQQLQHYTNEITRRSFGLADIFDTESMFMRFGVPIFTCANIIVGLYQLYTYIVGYFPSIIFGLSDVPSGRIGETKSDVTKEESGERNQRLLDALEHQVKSAVVNAQNAYENELKKKK